MKKSALRIIFFIIILGLVLTYVNKVFKIKYDDMNCLSELYDLEKDTIDVLFIGSSHAYEDINTGLLWDAYGIAAFDLGGSLQPMWNTYYYLREALKTQRPKVIVLEGYRLLETEDYVDESKIIKNNYGLKISQNKMESLMASVPANQIGTYLLEYTQYHDRYSELSAEDFMGYMNNIKYKNWKGFNCNMLTESYDEVDVSMVVERLPISLKTEKYYRMIFELAKSENIPIVVMISPYSGITEEAQMKYNYADDVAKECGVQFINWNLFNKEIGINFATDFADIGHLNYRGNQKYSFCIGSYLKTKYDIPDRREDKRYVSWQNDADYTRRLIYNEQIIESTDIPTLMNLLCDPDYLVAVSIDGECSKDEVYLSECLSKLGICGDNYSGIWFRQNNELVWKTSDTQKKTFINTLSCDICLKQEQGINSIIIDNVKYSKLEDGINVVVYDTITEQVVDCFGIDLNNGYNVVR